MPEEDTLLNLYDTYWFECGVFTAQPLFPAVDKSPVRDDRVRENDQVPESDEPRLNPITTQMRKFPIEVFLRSEHHLGNLTNISSASPKSVLAAQLPSGVHRFHKRYRVSSTRKKTGSRTLSELELEELKGFMELGFAFSGKNMNPRLVSIVPGLQKLVDNGEESGERESVTRPYLSEAWDCLEYDEGEIASLMDLRILDIRDEVELKDHLKSWAHMVASTIRRQR